MPTTPIPASGPGWTLQNAYLGFAYQSSQETGAATAALGIHPIDAGDMKATVQALLDDVNAHGGLFGRKVVPVYADVPATPNPTGQEQCATWTQDNRVFAVANTLIAAPSLYGCLAQAHVPFSNSQLGYVNQNTLQQFQPWFRALIADRSDSLLPTWVSRLSALNYFTPWDTTLGRAGTAPARIGLLYADNDQGVPRDFSLLAQLLHARGYNIAATFGYCDCPQGAQELGNAVLKFRQANVTHVLSDTGNVLFFMREADTQGYRPRYGLTSNNALNTLLQPDAPATQLHGSLGVGFVPNGDVDPSAAPSRGTAQATCLDVLKRRGINPTTGPSLLSDLELCDAVNLYVDAARLGGGLSWQSIQHGMSSIGSIYQSAAVFQSGLSATRFDESAAVRDLGWNDRCSCFRYLGTSNWPS